MIRLAAFIIMFFFPWHLEEKKSITPELLKEWVTFLSSDEMKGRSNGSPEMATAASWIASRFKEDGLRQFGSAPDFIQKYSYKSRSGEIKERNVIGYIEGSDPVLKNQFIVVSAHFDHVGMNRGGADSVFNGADDNAAGTATLLAIAKKIQESDQKPGMSIIFAAFSGEEHGLKGSKYFVSNCPVPTGKIYADFNFEMTGHSELLGKNKYYMTGCPYSDMDDIIKEYEKGTGFALVDTISLANELFRMSDNISFSSISLKDGKNTGIPSGTFATSTLPPYLHHVSDEADLFDFENMSALANHFSDIVMELSLERRPVSWTNSDWVRP